MTFMRYYSPTFDLLDTFRFFGDTAENRYRTDTACEEGIKIEMPGVKSADLDVTITGRTLKVSGKSRHGKEFTQVYSLKGTIDETAISANLQDGLLEITLPQKAESKSRKIPIT